MTTQPVVSDRHPHPSSKCIHRGRQAAVIAALCVAFAFLCGTAGIASQLQVNLSVPATPYVLTSFDGSYFKTSWGVSCLVTADHVNCQSCVPGQVITNAYTCSDPAPGVAVTPAGIVNRNAGDVASSSTSQQLASGQTYHADGWTIVASGGWARFINDATGHGMAVAAQNFDSF